MPKSVTEARLICCSPPVSFRGVGRVVVPPGVGEDDRDELGAVRDGELSVDVPEVVLDRLGADEQLDSRLTIRGAVPDGDGDAELGWRES